MAHAARLIQRMQKELRLLLSDPPPGASFPFLSTDDNAPSSFSTIYALIEGPVGTVYANGVFKITIQIPERYPFQPPSITFATPIYHPNIDNGGRICLDILNLPPKGAWQPSLNISTVLTSIGLLLSEPNPDDGLMCEVSREYKYDRQVFNEKARSMTEKHAKPGADLNNHGSSQVAQSSSGPCNQTQAEGSNNEVNGQVVNHKKRYGMSKKLSLEFFCPNSRMNEHGGKVRGGGPNESSVGGGEAEEPVRETELDAIVVLDSEDSEGEEGMDGLVSRSKLLVARRTVAGKRKQLPH